jgi:hypothetical protein
VGQLEKNIFEKYNTVLQECYEYDPIQNTNNLALSFDEVEPEEAGCDSCIHFNKKVCDIFKKEY